MADWNAVCQEWLSGTEWVAGGGIVSCEDGCFYACDNADKIYQCEHQATIMREDMSEVQVTINEPDTLIEAFKNGGKAKNGVWLATKKYTFINAGEVDGMKSYTYARSGGGLFLVCTGNGYAVLSIWDASLEQDKANALVTTAAFAKYLSENGY